MIEKIILYFFAALITFGGFYVLLKPYSISSFLKKFYSNYPLVRYAGEKQLTSRPIFIRLVGIVIIFIGMAGMLGILIK